LERALHEVGVEGRQAVLNVLTVYSDTDAKRDAKREQTAAQRVSVGRQLAAKMQRGKRHG
jgi:hypothetical protein